MSTAEVANWETHLVRVMSSERFLQMQGLGGEMPFYIYPYDPTDALEIAQSKKRVITKLARQGVSILEVDLYDLIVEILQTRGVWEGLLEIEPVESKVDFREGLASMLNPGEDLVPAIQAKLAESNHDILFLTGVGEVFPVIRSHNVLNNIPTVAKNAPMLMFFPGDYEQSNSLGSSLVLFGAFKDDQYYRAKDIREQEA